MKSSNTIRHLVLLATLLIFCFPTAEAQLLKKLGKTAERAAERTVQRRVDHETSKKTDQVLDSILEPGSKGEQYPNDPNSGSDPTVTGGVDMGPGNNSTPGATEPASIQVYSKFDFVPGDKQLFYDDFGYDFVGDFPARWNTNGSGEVVTIGDSPVKWLKLLQGYGVVYIPDVGELPSDYTIEFDLFTTGIDNKTSSTAGLTITLDSNTSFKSGTHYGWAFLPLGQYGVFKIRLRNYAPGKGSEINTGITADIRSAVLNQPHISIAVNEQRFRLWVNEKKYVDVPRFIPEGADLNTIKFNINGLKDGKEDVYITNLKVAEGGVDLRRKLIAEGKISTNGILFDSGSATIQPQSMGIIRQIFQVLQQERSMRLRIVGHTDADGDDSSNMELSRQRADAVKNALVDIYQIDGSRLETDGKGETEPVGDNGTVDGKAQNRRVEFIRL